MEKINVNYDSLVKIIAELPRAAKRSFFLTACLNEDLQLCQACIDAKVDMKIGDDDYGQPFFCDYVKNPRAKTHVVDWLLANGLDINHHSEGYFSPLKKACSNCNSKMVKYLLDKKAKFTPLEGNCNHEGEICWTLADRLSDKAEQFEIIKLLLEAGAPLNVNDESTNNPLYMAIYYGYNVDFVKIFLEYGISANLLVHGVSLLNLAVSKGDCDTVSVLLENGADVNSKLNNLLYTKKYMGAITPMDIAIQTKNKKIQHLLKTHGGIPSTKQEKLNNLFKCKEDKEVVDIIQKVVQE